MSHIAKDKPTLNKQKLTPKQKKFIQEYLKCGNATEAAIKAGYSKKTARIIGCENLTKPNIAEHLGIKQKKIQEKYELTEDIIIQEIASVALSKATDFTVEGIPLVEGATHKTASKLKALDMLVKITGIDSDSKLKKERFEHEKDMDDKKYF